MLTADEIKVAVVMMKRAQCTGDEAPAVAVVIQKLIAEFNRLQQEAQQGLRVPVREPELDENPEDN